eukprot:g30403.t1
MGLKEYRCGSSNNNDDAPGDSGFAAATATARNPCSGPTDSRLWVYCRRESLLWVYCRRESLLWAYCHQDSRLSAYCRRESLLWAYCRRESLLWASCHQET